MEKVHKVVSSDSRLMTARPTLLSLFVSLPIVVKLTTLLVISQRTRFVQSKDDNVKAYLNCLSNAIHGQNINLPVCVYLWPVIYYMAGHNVTMRKRGSAA